MSESMSRATMRRVFLDPVGAWTPDWLAVVVQAPTGVLYQQQCAGVACEHREVEGYLVPLGALAPDPAQGGIAPGELTTVFHTGNGCTHGAKLGRLPADREARLQALVASVPFWTINEAGSDVCAPLMLDESRCTELTEAWVPVITPDGPGVLMWSNCD
jgi:hypothetical protein